MNADMRRGSGRRDVGRGMSDGAAGRGRQLVAEWRRGWAREVRPPILRGVPRLLGRRGVAGASELASTRGEADLRRFGRQGSLGREVLHFGDASSVGVDIARHVPVLSPANVSRTLRCRVTSERIDKRRKRAIAGSGFELPWNGSITATSWSSSLLPANQPHCARLVPRPLQQLREIK